MSESYTMTTPAGRAVVVTVDYDQDLCILRYSVKGGQGTLEARYNLDAADALQEVMENLKPLTKQATRLQIQGLLSRLRGEFGQ